MRIGDLSSALAVRQELRNARPDVYSYPASALTGLFYTPNELEQILRDGLIGRTDLADLAIRTRSKVAKALVCEVLGYTVPESFRRVNPRLPHPNLDVYVQQANNMQIWNEEIDAARRYVVVILDRDVIFDVYVIAGADLLQFDNTGTLTKKFQANRIRENTGSVLASQCDTEKMVDLFWPSVDFVGDLSPVAPPSPGNVLDVHTVFERLYPMVGETFDDPGRTQERIRGSVVHREACERLGLSHYADNGQFPDVLSQALEIKLQLARTIDLGLELPESVTPVASTNGVLAVRDMRYAIFYGVRTGSSFTLTELIVVTGADFFSEFRQFQGRVSNSKIQLRLPAEWFPRTV